LHAESYKIADMTFNVTEGHWEWHYFTDHKWLATSLPL